jgi:DNA modification methylase
MKTFAEGRSGLKTSRKIREPLALHPTVRPIAMVADAILDCSVRGNIVLDPFLGSGTTPMAAERVGRICHGIEIDPLYVGMDQKLHCSLIDQRKGRLKRRSRLGERFLGGRFA